MRILMIANIVPYQLGGAEVQARLLAEAFNEQGHEVIIAGNRIVSGRIPGVKGDIETIRIKVFSFNRLSKAFSYFISLTHILLARRGEYDIIYCRFIQEPALVPAFLKWLGLLKMPLVALPEASGIIGDVTFLKALPGSRFLILLLQNHCDRINILSKSIEDELLGEGFEKSKFSYIPNGIRISDFLGLSLTQEKNTPAFIFVGRLIPQKGLRYLVQAFANLIKENQLASLTIVGYGSEENALKAMVRQLGMGAHIHFPGKVENIFIPSLLQKHDIFILPSLAEGFGVVLIEAMASGLPVIATQCGVAEYIIDDHVGLLCRPEHVQDLEDAMLKMMQRPEEQLMSMKNESRKRVHKRFDIREIARKYITLFDQCLKP